MTQLANQTVAMVIAFCLLLGVLVAPFVLAWIALSIRRDMRRIADALDGARLANYDPPAPSDKDPIHAITDHERNIANSLFGRKY
jgi:hypothetical protein